MGGQVLGGGVIVLVAVVLWLVYLVPSWYSRHQYTSAERNAVRLNQALRVLAETSETPREVRLELTARTALAQQKLARRAQEEKEQAELAIARAKLEVAKEQGAAEREAARAELAAAREIARAQSATAREAARAQQAAARALPAARRARTRRAFRLTTTLVAVASLVLAGVGGVQALAGGSLALVWVGSVLAVACVAVLHRLSRVASRSGVREVAAPATRAVPVMQDVALPAPRVTSWTPRELPRPLVSSAGSRAAAVLDEQAAREALRAAAREEAMREIAEKQAPPSIENARVARQSQYDRMGYVDDAEIEAHVRSLLARRAVGE